MRLSSLIYIKLDVDDKRAGGGTYRVRKPLRRGLLLIPVDLETREILKSN